MTRQSLHPEIKKNNNNIGIAFVKQGGNFYDNYMAVQLPHHPYPIHYYIFKLINFLSVSLFDFPSRYTMHDQHPYSFPRKKNHTHSIFVAAGSIKQILNINWKVCPSVGLFRYQQIKLRAFLQFMWTIRRRRLPIIQYTIQYTFYPTQLLKFI